MKMLKKIFAFVLLFSIVFSSIGINTYAKDTSDLTEVEDSTIMSPTEDGKRTFTLKGSDLEKKDIKAKVVLKGSTERLTEVEKSITFSEETKENTSKKVVTLTFPKNETGKMQQYEVSFSVKGDDKSFVDEFKKVVRIRKSSSGSGAVNPPSNPDLPKPPTPEQPKPSNPNPNDENAIVSVSPESKELSAEGGEVKLSLITMRVNGNHISAKDVKVQVLLNNMPTDLRKNAIVEGEKAKKTITLNFPKNNTSKEEVYTIKFNTKGSETDFQESPTVKVTVGGSEQSRMLINELKVKTPNLPKTGGLNTITVRGENLKPDKLKLEIFKIENGVETRVEMDYNFNGTSEVQSATLNFPKAKFNKKEVYKIRLNDKEVIVTVGAEESGDIIDLLPSNVYLDNSKTKITVKFDEKVFEVKDIETLRAGISFKKSTSDNFENLKAEDKVEVLEDKIVITLESPIEIKTGAKIKFEERIIKDGKNRENRAFDQFIKDSFPTVNEANFVEGEVLTKVGGNAKVKLIGENLSKAVKVKILRNNKDKTSNSEITESADIKVEVINNNQQIIDFKLPENKTAKAETYSVMVSLDDGKTYSSAIGVNILQNRAKRLVATVLPTDKITDKPILSFMSIQSYGTTGGGTEHPDITHTYTPIGQESKKTWVTMFGANFNKSLTKIKIVDENGIEWYPLQNEGTSDSMDNFIMVSADGTGIYGNGNTQMFELICPRNVTNPKNPNGDVTFKYLVAVDGENYNQEIFVRATVVNDKVGKKEKMTADEISEINVKHQAENGKEVFKGATVKGYKWSKLRSFNVRPIENNADFKAVKYKIVRADGTVEEKEIGHIHEEKVRDIKEVTFIYKSNINPEEPANPEIYKWVKNDDGTWTYQSADGKLVVKDSWKFIDNEWYRFNKDGKMLSNQWFEENGKWYYIEKNGIMSKNEWVLVNGKWYYANASGRISQNEWVLVNGNWYFANASGRIADSEWFIVEGKWYYAEKGGLITQGKTLKINYVNYTFDSNGVLVN